MRNVVPHRRFEVGRPPARLLLVFAGVFCASFPALADEQAPPPAGSSREEAAATGPHSRPVTTIENERAWTRGVSEAAQEQARTLFAQANAHLKDSFFQQAATEYRQALALWNHPGIHYNLALALLNLDQPLEVREHLLQAVRYGSAPLDEDKYEYAQSYLKLLEQQLAPIEIRCSVPGAIVKLDDAHLFHAPGSYKGYLRPGRHRIQATKPGFATNEQVRTLLPGEPTRVDLRVYTEDELTRYRRRWPVWAPVTVIGGGVALAAAGGIFLMQSKRTFEEFDHKVDKTSDCIDDGCQLSPSLSDLRNRANTYQTLGGIGLGVGSAALVTGTVLLFLNAPVAYRVEPEDLSARRGLRIEPRIGSGFAGISARGEL
ncbi:MAG TPA: carboxypeptidase-like regulatory domain-containing protein [Polyangiaceae bacterium]|nr:carboxypeptidase-like regulatory domain-containing protein [Polyangiaceae bacterium]